MVQLVFYVPEEACERVKAALFAKGAGRTGRYDSCAWQVRGEGQFRPLSGSHPARGEVGKLHRLPEYRVEMACEEAVLSEVVTELLRVHPYEEPAYGVFRIEDAADLGLTDS